MMEYVLMFLSNQSEFQGSNMIIIITCLMLSFYRWVGVFHGESMSKSDVSDINIVINGLTLLIDIIVIP